MTSTFSNNSGRSSTSSIKAYAASTLSGAGVSQIAIASSGRLGIATGLSRTTGHGLIFSP
ncbi:hypothetical protein IQ277_10375 [Nostocales cyanobacterium LEGE 12452]|nr:hypothetical protein [Nostocales cyanobacterium LEGE 12452]